MPRIRIKHSTVSVALNAVQAEALITLLHHGLTDTGSNQSAAIYSSVLKKLRTAIGE